MLAIDPSLTATGWVLLELGAEPLLVSAGVIETAPTPKKRRGLQLEDDMRRARYIRRELRLVIETYRPALTAIEAGFGSQNAKAAKSLAIAQTAASLAIDEQFAEARALYVTVHEAGDAIGLARTQRAATGKAKTAKERGVSSRARKAKIAELVIARFGVDAWARALACLPHQLEGDHFEGAFDAAAVALAAWEHPVCASVRAIAARQTTIEERRAAP
jgi:Holliday junction resolvasome RuvABC endonuclease subunit